MDGIPGEISERSFISDSEQILQIRLDIERFELAAGDELIAIKARESGYGISVASREDYDYVREQNIAGPEENIFRNINEPVFP